MGLAARLFRGVCPVPCPSPHLPAAQSHEKAFQSHGSLVPSQEQLCRDRHWDIAPEACPPPTARGPPVSSLPHRPECCLGRSPAFWLR